jgi:hypothetical protein
VVRNVGGGRPGEVDRATHGAPGKIGFCFAENDIDSPYGTLASQFGVPHGTDALTVFAGEGPRCIVDQLSRDPESLAGSLSLALQAMHHPKLVLAFDAILVMGPEHARVFAEAGWDRDRILSPAPRPTWHAGPAGSPRGCRWASPPSSCPSSSPTGCCWRTPVAAPACSRP